MFTYRISGLTVQSEIELPGVAPAALEYPAGQVLVRRGKVPVALENPRVSTPVWQIDEHRFLLRLSGIARFLATDGSSIDMEAEPGADASEGLPFLLGTAFGALLLQRGSLVLHASCVGFRGQAFAFCGPNGIGKSTLAAALCAAGCSFVSDDILTVDLNAGGQPCVWPDGRRLKLFNETIDRLDLISACDGEVRAGLAKHYVAPPCRNTNEFITLAAIYRVRDQTLPKLHGIRPLSILDAAQAILDDTYRPRRALAVAKGSRQFAVTAAVLQQARIFDMTRRRDLSALGDTVDELMAHWRELRSDS